MAALSLEAPGTTEGARISIHSEGKGLYGVNNPERTLPDLFEEGRKATGDGNFLGTTEGEVQRDKVIDEFLFFKMAHTIRPKTIKIDLSFS